MWFLRCIFAPSNKRKYKVMKEDYLFYASLARENFMWCKVTKKTMFNKMLYKHYVLKAHEAIKGKQ